MLKHGNISKLQSKLIARNWEITKHVLNSSNNINNNNNIKLLRNRKSMMYRTIICS